MKNTIAMCLALALGASTTMARSEQTSDGTDQTVKLIIAGAGDAVQVQTFIDDLVAYLTATGVRVRQVESDGQGKAGVVSRMKSIEAHALLFVMVDIQAGQLKDRATLQYVDQQGRVMWQEEVSGGMFNASASGALKNMMKNMKKKLEKRISNGEILK